MRVLDLRLEDEDALARDARVVQARRRRHDEHDDGRVPGEGGAPHGARTCARARSRSSAATTRRSRRRSSTAITSTSSSKARASTRSASSWSAGRCSAPRTTARSTACAARATATRAAFGASNAKREQTHEPRRAARRRIESSSRNTKAATSSPRIRPMASIFTSRGCSFDCNFCAIWEFYERRTRFLSAKKIVDQMEACDEPFIFVLDDNFLTNKRRVVELCDEIERRGVKKYWMTQGRTDFAADHPELMARLAKNGLVMVLCRVRVERRRQPRRAPQESRRWREEPARQRGIPRERRLLDGHLHGPRRLDERAVRRSSASTCNSARRSAFRSSRS